MPFKVLVSLSCSLEGTCLITRRESWAIALSAQHPPGTKTIMWEKSQSCWQKLRRKPRHVLQDVTGANLEHSAWLAADENKAKQGSFGLILQILHVRVGSYNLVKLVLHWNA